MVRFKNRYVCFEVLFDPALAGSDASGQQPSFTARVIYGVVRDSVKLNFGDSGLGLVLSGMQVRHFGAHSCMGILKVPRDHCKMVLSALALITHVHKHPCAVRVRHVSGTIKKCQRAAIRTDRELIIAWHQRQQQLATAGTPSINDSTLSQLLKESESQISAIEI
ncbi:RNA-binding protein pop5 [Coemansia sp. RSA 2706]|nr:RNA-binding protein pop5 [Coemansia sp. RSA 2711]KAJ2308567.1 RNA-binding protein pop5 [Coemansia sp. RSA 2706]KAJ2309213.1 RNA-binding protein pop5 [Coemansia sp. RSA 2705]KAJ2329787.1 RNA-binding protein pop5 [Coemansia sp. RSA 2702]KAJ2385900.1 RNA-binding protein pop5 [Coemansia sp. RSA 2611]KAJ2739444.1 RNA-binding protein pop5 [Coemansia sp. Cherry 401B]